MALFVSLNHGSFIYRVSLSLLLSHLYAGELQRTYNTSYIGNMSHMSHMSTNDKSMRLQQEKRDIMRVLL